MAWVESHQSLSKHRKTLAVVAALKVDRHKLIGHLHELWWWALDNAKSDGSIGNLAHLTIAEAAGWPGKQASMFVGALIDAGFLEQTPEGLVIHDWYDFAGKLNDQRELRRESNRQAQSKHRQRLLSADVSNDSKQASALTDADGQHDKADSQHPTVPNRTQPNRTGPTEPENGTSPELDPENSLAGSPRLANPAREARATSARGGGFRPIGALIDRDLVADHERRVAAERASQAMPSQPEENSLNGNGDDHAHD